MLFVGIDIKRYQSGHTHCRDTINKRGNKKARKLFILGDYEYNKRAASL
ncbi:transposase [Staphylococcus epidermidis]